MHDNKFVTGMMDMLKKHRDSVNIMSSLDNASYDSLLSSSIVFLNLADASAVNTVIECIVRNTPIYVNRLPALEEMLGKEYPGFYDNICDAEIAMMNIAHVTRVHAYLKRLSKTPFKLSTFVRAVYDCLIQVT
jgi:hypothetical protein